MIGLGSDKNRNTKSLGHKDKEIVTWTHALIRVFGHLYTLFYIPSMFVRQVIIFKIKCKTPLQICSIFDKNVCNEIPEVFILTIIGD